jgi:hypothetical protein
MHHKNATRRGVFIKCRKQVTCILIGGRPCNTFPDHTPRRPSSGSVLHNSVPGKHLVLKECTLQNVYLHLLTLFEAAFFLQIHICLLKLHEVEIAQKHIMNETQRKCTEKEGKKAKLRTSLPKYFC